MALLIGSRNLMKKLADFIGMAFAKQSLDLCDSDLCDSDCCAS